MKQKIEKIINKKIPSKYAIGVIFVFTALAVGGFAGWMKKTELFFQPMSVESPAKQKEVLPDTSDWKTYQDKKYNFEIKYPSSWADPQPKTVNDKDFVYQYKVSFGTTDTLSENDNEGFAVFVTKKDSSDENIDLGDCIANPTEAQSNNSLPKSPDQFDPRDQCLLYKLKLAGEDPGYYSYQFMGQDFEYNFFPTLIDDPKSSLLTTQKISQFEAAANTFALDFEAIESAKKKAAERLKQQAIAAEKARIKSQYRPSTQKSVCIEAHIHPSKSDKQGKHIDEDCCPDPDEWPNLRCKYKSSDYGILIGSSPPQKLLGKD